MRSPRAAAIAFCVAVAGLSMLPGWQYLLFPELAALATVVLVDPRGPWARRPLQLVLLPTLTAVIGIAISRLVADRALAILLAVALARLCLGLQRSSLVPALPTAVLPVILSIRNWLYPVQVCLVLIALVAVLRWRQAAQEPQGAASAVALAGMPAAETGSPPAGVAAAASNAAAAAWFGRHGPLTCWFLFLGVLVVAEQLSGLLGLLAPPLIVISHEAFTAPARCDWSRRPWVLPLACGGAAAAGVLASRLWGGIPVLAVAAALLVASGLLGRLRLSLPPVLALAVLPVLLPTPDARFVLAVLITATALACLQGRWPPPSARP